MDTLLRECGDYLALSLKSAEMVQSERQALKQQVIGEKEIVDEVKSAVRLVVQHAAARRGPCQPIGSKRTRTIWSAAARNLRKRISEMDPSLATMLSSFEDWLAGALRDELTVLSIRERSSFLAPCTKFGNRHSARFNNFGTACRIAPCGRSACRCGPRKPKSMSWSPGAPDIRVGRVFDRNWELLSPMLPVWMIKAAVRRHFARTIAYLVYQNLSRLSTQWEESINGALGRREGSPATPG
jgi:hypothetical protein